MENSLLVIIILGVLTLVNVILAIKLYPGIKEFVNRLNKDS